MLSQIFAHPTLLQKPPVLIDIGASGALHGRWRKIAKYAICIGFDADKRDFAYSEADNKGYKKLYLYHALVADKVQEKATFHLTASPHCSSLLPPDTEGLQYMAWAERFEVTETVEMATTDLPTVLGNLGLEYVDWFKTDSQGIDLRLFQSLPASIKENVLVAEFEPGIINAYQDEDKMHQVLAYMHTQKHFWLVDLIIKGSARISATELKLVGKGKFWQKLLMFSLPKSADWGEMLYLHTLENQPKPAIRELLLAWALAIECRQAGWASHLARRGQTLYPEEPLFPRMLRYAHGRLWRNVWRLGFLPALKTKIRQIFGWV